MLPGSKDKFKDLNQKVMLDRAPEMVTDGLLAEDDGFFDAGDSAQVKYEMLRYVAKGHSVDEALRTFGYSSRRSFYRAQAAFQQAGLAGLVSIKRNPGGNAAREIKNYRPRPHLRPNSTERTLARMQEELHEFSSPLANVFVSDYLEIDFVMRKVRVGTDKIRLTPKEFDLLRYLVSQAGRPIPHRELLRAVWGPQFSDRIDCLRVCVMVLRKKIEPDPSQPRYILTEPCVGYRFMASSE